MLGYRLRFKTIVLISVLALVQLWYPYVALAQDSASPSPAKTMSTRDSFFGASLVGAGMALMLTSALIEGKYEKVTGYRVTSGGFDYPITTSGGNDTTGFLVAGAGFVVIGLSFLFFPGGSGDSEPSSDHAGLKLEVPALDKQNVAVGVSYGF